MRELIVSGKTIVLSFVFIILTIPLISSGKSFYIDLNQQIDRSELWFLSDRIPDQLISGLNELDTSNHSRYKIVFDQDNYFALSLKSHKIFLFNTYWQELSYDSPETMLFVDIFLLNSKLIGITKHTKDDLEEKIYTFKVYKKRWELIDETTSIANKYSDIEEVNSLVLNRHFQPYKVVQFKSDQNVFVLLDHQLNMNFRNSLILQSFNHLLVLSMDSDSAYYIHSSQFKIYPHHANTIRKHIIQSPYIYLNNASLYYQNPSGEHASLDLELLSHKKTSDHFESIDDQPIGSIFVMSLMAIVIFIFLGLFIFFKTNLLRSHQKSKDLHFEIKTEYQRILIKLMEQQGRIMDTNDLDVIFGIDHLGYENKRGKRAKLIKEVNTYTQILYGINIINRKKNEQDKRYYDYHISFVKSQ